jgi:hypothetical protein
MKQFINYTYTFSPGASGVGYVDLTGISSFNIRSLVAIINQTTGQLIYSTASTVLKYTGISGTRVFLNKDTTGMSAADKLLLMQLI